LSLPGASPSITVMIVDDNEDHRHLMARRISEAGFSVRPAQSAAEALANLDGVDLVLLDQRLPGASGIEVLGAIRERGPSVVMVTGVGSEALAVEAMRSGAADYVVKNAGYLAELPRVVERAWRHHDLEQRASELQRVALLVSSAADRESTFSEIVTGTRRLLRAEVCALYVAGSDGVSLEAFAGERGRHEHRDLHEVAVRALSGSGPVPVEGEGERRLVVPLPSLDGSSPLGVLIVVCVDTAGYLPE
jgi:DNA-binding NtrC family response regulator